MKLDEFLLGQIPEAIYFALFMLFAKRLTDKKLKFITFMILEYILLLYAFPYSIWSHILFFAITYIILKLIYKEKAQLTDIFMLGIASIILMVISIGPSLLFKHNIVGAIITSRLMMFIFLAVFRNKLYNVQKLYKHLWNRNDAVKKRMKSTTFRALNTVAFNLMFYVINACILYALIFRK